MSRVTSSGVPTVATAEKIYALADEKRWTHSQIAALTDVTVEVVKRTLERRPEATS